MKINSKILIWRKNNMNENTNTVLQEDKLDEIIKLLKIQNKQKNISSKVEKDEDFPSDEDREFIENSVELVLTKLCPDYPVKERSGYFELGNFFVLIQLHNSKNHLIVGMKSEHGMKRELLELSFVYTEKGGFEITDYPDHIFNNLVFKFFIELRNEIERKRLLKARSTKFQKFLNKIKEKLSVKDSWEV